MKLKRFVMVDGNPEQTNIAMNKLKQMEQFCESDTCRRQYLMQYFGEKFPAYCGSCDYCMSSLEQKDATIDAQKLLSAIVRTGERYGAGYIIDFLRGSASEKILASHKELKTYGIGREMKKDEWDWLIKQMLNNGYLERTEDQYATLQLNHRSHEILKGETKLMLVVHKGIKDQLADEEVEELGYDEQLMKDLRGVRYELADREHVPAYNILPDNSLVEMATYLPQTFEELKQISGFGDYKVGKYGAYFIKVLKQYAEDNKLASKVHLKAPKATRTKKAAEPKQPTAGNTQLATLSLFREGMTMQEIAAQRGLSMSTIENHLSLFVTDGTIEILQLVPQRRLDKILEGIQQSGQTAALKPIRDILGEEYTYGEIRLAIDYFRSGRK